MPRDTLNLRGTNVHAYGPGDAALNLRRRSQAPSGSGLQLRGAATGATGRGFPPKSIPQSSDHPFEHNSPAKAKMKPFTQEKAKEILSEDKPTLHGKRPTKKQLGLLGLIAGGGTPTRLKRRKRG